MWQQIALRWISIKNYTHRNLCTTQYPSFAWLRRTQSLIDDVVARCTLIKRSESVLQSQRGCKTLSRLNDMTDGSWFMRLTVEHPSLSHYQRSTESMWLTRYTAVETTCQDKTPNKTKPLYEETFLCHMFMFNLTVFCYFKFLHYKFPVNILIVMSSMYKHF